MQFYKTKISHQIDKKNTECDKILKRTITRKCNLEALGSISLHERKKKVGEGSKKKKTII